MTVKTGYFDAFVNGKAARPGAPEKALMARIDTVVKATIPRSQLHWAGSQRKGTAIIGSDLDICVASPEPVTEALRRTLRSHLEAAIGRPTTHGCPLRLNRGVGRSLSAKLCHIFVPFPNRMVERNKFWG
jgi:hypothetical protein